MATHNTTRSFPKVDGHWRLSAGVSFEKSRLNEPGRLFQFSIFPISPFVRLEKSTHWEGTKATEEGLLLRSIGLHCQSFKGKNQGIWRPPFNSLAVRICATGPRLPPPPQRPGNHPRSFPKPLSKHAASIPILTRLGHLCSYLLQGLSN